MDKKSRVERYKDLRESFKNDETTLLETKTTTTTTNIDTTNVDLTAERKYSPEIIDSNDSKVRSTMTMTLKDILAEEKIEDNKSSTKNTNNKIDKKINLLLIVVICVGSLLFITILIMLILSLSGVFSR